MNLSARLLLCAALAFGMVSTIVQPNTAVAGKKDHHNNNNNKRLQEKILAYRNAYTKTQRFIIWNGGRITARTDDPLTQQGTIRFFFPLSTATYIATIDGTKVRIELLVATP